MMESNGLVTKTAWKLLPVMLTIFMVGCTNFNPLPRIPPRTMGVELGPERVFAQPVTELLPELGGARATGVNGRIGPEMVFWGYQLADGRGAEMFACALHDDINCEARVGAICPAGGQELTRTIVPGLVRHLNCRPVGIAQPGDLRPNCEDFESNDDLLVGLMQCR